MIRRLLNLLVSLACIVAVAASERANAASKSRQVLFVCTGNFYRSRFAEALFNQKARAANLDWHASSRGLNLVPWQFGISPYAKQELVKRNVSRELWSGTPKRLTKDDVAQSDCIVLMDETEHRRPFESRFPKTDAAKIRYWHIPDTGRMNPAQACAKMSAQIDDFIKSLDRKAK